MRFPSIGYREGVKKFSLMGVFFILFSSQLWAQDPQVEQPSQDPPKSESEKTSEEKKEETLEEIFIRRNIQISEWFDGVAEGLDLFLVGEKVTNRPNESSLRLENSTTVREREGMNNSFGIGVNLRLPNVEDYWQLKFTNYDERRDRRETRREFLRQEQRPRSYGATVALFKKLGDIRTSFQPRVELEDPFRISHTLIFESIADLRTYQVNPKLEFFANPDQGVGAFVGLNLNFILSRVFTVTLVNEGEYGEKSHSFGVTNGISLGQEVQRRKSSLSYGLYTNSSNREVYHLESYTFAVTWNDLVYKKIFDYQVTPHLLFARIYDFKATPGLTLSMALNF